MESRKNSRFKAHTATIIGLVIVLYLLILPIINAGWWQGNEPTSYYKFENSLEDNSTNGFDLTTQGTTAYGTGKLGSYSRYYDGTDYNYVDSSTFKLSTGTYTIALWFNSSSLGTNDALFYINGSEDLTLRESSNNLLLRQDDGTSANICNFGADTGYANESWHRIVIVRDGTGANEVRCYADGRNVINGTNAADLDGTRLSLSSGKLGVNLTGHIDDFVIYNGVAWSVTDVAYDWNSGNGREADKTYVELATPINNLNTTLKDITFNASVIPDTGLELTNITYYLWYDNSSLVNETIYNLTGTTTNSTQHLINGLSEGDYLWNAFGCMNDSSRTICDMASSNRTLNIKNVIFRNSYQDSEIAERADSTFQMNISIGSGLSISQAVLVYNNTDNTGSAELISGDNYSLSETITTPDVTSSTNITTYWKVTLDDGNQYNSTEINQTVNPFGIDDCSSYGYQLFNLTIYDEDDQSIVDGGVQNSSLKVFFQIFSSDGQLALLNYSANFSEKNPVKICMVDSLGSEDYRLDGVVEYTTDTRFTEFYYLQNYTLNSVSTNITLSLYSLLESTGQDFRITYKDSNFVPVESAIFDIQRRYTEEGIFRTVERPKTNVEGYTIGHLVTNDVTYNILVYKEGELLATFEEVVANCQNPTLQTCEINLNSYGTSTAPTKFTTDDDLTYSLTYNSTNRSIKSIFTIPSGAASTVSLNITLFDTLGTTNVCSNQIFASGGTLSCTIPNSFGNATVMADLYKDGVKVGGGIIRIKQDPADIYGGSIIVIAMLIFLVFIGIGASSDSPMMMGIMLIIGSFVLIGLNIIYSPSLWGAGATILWFIIAVVLVLIKGSNRQ